MTYYATLPPQISGAFIATLVRPVLNTAKLWLLKVVIANVVRQGQMDALTCVCVGYLGSLYTPIQGHAMST